MISPDGLILKNQYRLLCLVLPVSERSVLLKGIHHFKWYSLLAVAIFPMFYQLGFLLFITTKYLIEKIHWC